MFHCFDSIWPDLLFQYFDCIWPEVVFLSFDRIWPEMVFWVFWPRVAKCVLAFVGCVAVCNCFGRVPHMWVNFKHILC